MSSTATDRFVQYWWHLEKVLTEIETAQGRNAGLVTFTIMCLALVGQRLWHRGKAMVDILVNDTSFMLGTVRRVALAISAVVVLAAVCGGGGLVMSWLMWPADILLLNTRWWTVVLACVLKYATAFESVRGFSPLFLMALWASQSPSGPDDGDYDYDGEEDGDRWMAWGLVWTILRVGVIFGVHQHLCKTAGDEAWLVFMACMWYLWRWFAYWGSIASLFGFVLAAFLGNVVPAIIGQAVYRVSAERDVTDSMDAGGFGPLPPVPNAAPEVAKVLAAGNLFAVLGFTSLVGDLKAEEEKKFATCVRSAYKRLALRCHPDKTHNANGTTDALNRAKQAVAILSDSVKRSVYVEKLQGKGTGWEVTTEWNTSGR